jgi:hypothetical protein
MTESQTEYFCQNVKYRCCGSVRGLGNASNRGNWHLLEYTLNSKLNSEIGGRSCVVDILPTHEEPLDPISHIRVREGIIIVLFEQLEMHLPALQAIPPADLNEEMLFQMAIMYK